MEVLIVHYHLNAGGVTRVIEAQVRGLLAQPVPVRLSIACGGSGQQEFHKTSKFVDELISYNEKIVPPDIFAHNVASIVTFLQGILPESAILHCHNPNLGKNPALTMAVYILASRGVVVLNHCHDFAEDRPEKMELMSKMISGYTRIPLQTILYPDFRSYHFAVLTSCDFERISKQKIPDFRIHLLPNPVLPVEGKALLFSRERVLSLLGLDPHKKLCTYPVRAIQRKNLGEFVLLAMLFSDSCNFTITLAPLNPAELPKYNRWKSFCDANKINIRFEAGESVAFEELIHVSDFCLTTSIREGFGMAYLEPWLAGTPVIGRELTCIISDLKKKGLQFPRLYSKILISVPGKANVDFKDLTASEQETQIINIMNNINLRQGLIDVNPFLHNFFDPVDQSVIESNRQIIRKNFSIETYGNEISRIYQEISR